ncbi:hypothetical protein EDC94DRAFT_529636, partial [Helicostylum pulchrum]
CLEIPLASLIRPTPNSVALSRSIANLPCSVAYTLNTDRENCLRLKRFDELTVHPYLARKFLRLVQRDEIKLTRFFVRSFISHQYSSQGYYPFTQVSDHTKVNFTPFLVPLKLALNPNIPPVPLLLYIYCYKSHLLK